MKTIFHWFWISFVYVMEWCQTVKSNSKEQRRFTVSELREFDGKEGKPAYAAFRGKVYDVSNSRLWGKGKHAGRHAAGLDLTESIMNAPHDDKVFANFQIVGRLIQEEAVRKKFVQWLQRMHLHPIIVHFSISVPILFSFLAIMYLFTGEDSFEVVSYLILLLGFLAAIVGGLSGLFSWKVTYEGRMTRMFARKIYYTIILIALIIACLGWRTIDPNVLISKTTFSYIYLILVISLVPVNTLLGHYGGKIVYS
jgi:predicted heme/steroid binding protein/uncharacterized membrane protein